LLLKLRTASPARPARSLRIRLARGLNVYVPKKEGIPQ
jgi:hypothetical protein